MFPAHGGQGHAARAVRLLAVELADAGLRRALLVIDVGSRPSRRVAQAVGPAVLAGRTLDDLPSCVVHALPLARYRPVPPASSHDAVIRWSE